MIFNYIYRLKYIKWCEWSVVDILFNDRGTFKPYEGVIIDILTSNPTDIGIIYYISFSDGDFDLYREKIR